MSGPTTLEKGSLVCMMAPAPSLCLSLLCCLLSRGLNHVSPKHSVCLSTNTKTSEHADIWKMFFKNTYLFVFVFECLMRECEPVRNTAQHEEAGDHPLQCLCGRIPVSAVVLHPGTSSLLSYLHSPPTSPEECWDHRNTQVLPELQASPKVHTSDSYALGIDPSQSGLQE